MRHKRNKLIELDTGVNQTRSNVIRNLLTSLVKEWKVVTTVKRAKVLISEADSFFARLVRMFDLYKDQKDVRREAIRFVKSVIFTEEAGKKVVDELLPRYKTEWKTSSYVSNYKMWPRKWDSAEEILVKLS